MTCGPRRGAIRPKLSLVGSTPHIPCSHGSTILPILPFTAIHHRASPPARSNVEGRCESGTDRGINELTDERDISLRRASKCDARQVLDRRVRERIARVRGNESRTILVTRDPSKWSAGGRSISIDLAPIYALDTGSWSAPRAAIRRDIGV